MSRRATNTQRATLRKLASEEISVATLLEYYQSCKQPIANARSAFAHIQPRIETLFQKDYDCVIVSNEDGSLCPTYPYRICIPVGAKGCDLCEKKSHLVPSEQKLIGLFASSSLGRGRGRFVAPISLLHYHDPIDDTHYARFSLRSASLIQKPEVLLNKVTRRSRRLTKSMEDAAKLFNNVEIKPDEDASSKRRRIAEKFRIASKKNEKRANEAPAILESASEPIMSMEAMEVLKDEEVEEVSLRHSRMAKIRKEDLKSLHKLGVSFIGDLMVEEKLKLMRVLQVISSEKADKKNRYSDMKIFAMPFPGYEYFAACTWYAKKLQQANSGEDHHEYLEQAFDDVNFSWERLCSANINISRVLESIPEEVIHPQVRSVEWKRYRKWHINDMMQNYIKLIIGSMAAKSDITDEPFNVGGVLVHCIMGWDRTPTFISMLRLSLWADGIVNSSLSPEEIVFLTIAYDWISFGHDLVYRSKQGVELMYFCFNFLKNIESPQFSFQYALGHSELAEELAGQRSERLQLVNQTFMEVYKEKFHLL